MTRKPTPSDPEWRDTESSLAPLKVEMAMHEQKRLAEHRERAANDPGIRDALQRAGMTDPLLVHFRDLDPYQGPARAIARHYAMLAAATVVACPPGVYRDIALTRLLEARDAAAKAAS